MNRDSIIKLMLDGAYFDARDSKIYHSSFRKGWRKLTTGNISWQAVDRMHGIFGTKMLQETDRIYRLVNLPGNLTNLTR